MHATVVYNPKSGTSPELTELRRLFADEGIVIDNYIDITKNADGVKHAARAGNTLVVIGGDGTIGTAAQYVVNTEATLAPLPGGTLNHFTKDLGVPQELATAIANLKQARRRRIDVASVNQLIFVNNSSIGLYPSSLQVRERLQKWIGKWPAAAVGAIESFIKYQTYDVTVNNHTITTPFLFVGNNDYHLGRARQGRDILDGGILCVYTATCKNRWSLFSLVGYAAVGKLYAHQEFHRQKVEQLTIHTSQKSLRVSHDGEVSRLITPLQYKVVKKQLYILA